MKTLKHLKELLDHVVYYNKMAPFPVYDTEYVEAIKTKIKDMEENIKNYDDEPVVACKYCKSLHIILDDEVNNICMRCGSVNELQEFDNIHEYNDFIDGKK